MFGTNSMYSGAINSFPTHSAFFSVDGDKFLLHLSLPVKPCEILQISLEEKKYINEQNVNWDYTALLPVAGSEGHISHLKQCFS